MNTFVPGKPVPQPRPRAVRFKGGGIRMYEPATATAWKSTVATHMRGLDLTEPMEGGVAVELYFQFVRPKSHYTSRGVLTKNAPASCTLQRNGDADNLAKGVLDACQGILFENDSQVVVLNVSKSYASKQGVRIVWEEL